MIFKKNTINPTQILRTIFMEIRVREMVKNAIIDASTSFRDDQLAAYKHALEKEENHRMHSWPRKIRCPSVMIRASPIF